VAAAFSAAKDRRAPANLKDIDLYLYVRYAADMNHKPRPEGCCAAPMPPAPLANAERERLTAAFKALADSTRFDVFRLIAAQDEPICACDVVDRFDVSQPTISHHLKVLRDAGLIVASRRGVWAYYAVDPRANDLLGSTLARLAPERRAAG
jgi:ArsR family transcriptional regulator